MPGATPARACTPGQFRGAGQFFLLDRALVDIGVGVSWLRSQGVEVVVLLGNSGGGSLMAAYNAQSQSPVLTQPFGPPLLPEATGLPPGNLYVSVVSSGGAGFSALVDAQRRR